MQKERIEYKNPILTLNVDDRVLFTEDNWCSEYKGKIVSLHHVVGYYKVWGSRYGYANCSPQHIKLIKP